MKRRRGRVQEENERTAGQEDADEGVDDDSAQSHPEAAVQPKEKPGHGLIRGWALSCLSHLFLVVSIGSACMLLLLIVVIIQGPVESVSVALPVTLPAVLPPRPTRTPAVTPTPQAPPVAILAGHSGGIDPGAICPDGLREVDVTTDVAKRVKEILEGRGYRVDVLAEFDQRLNGYKRDYAPRVFLAIHADSCVYYASGYKMARAASSASPQEDDRLVRCVSTAYAAATSLPFHAGSITLDMTRYHGLNEISPLVPGAIIELGFLGSQHDLLKNRRPMLAEAIATGLNAFLTGDQCNKGDTN